MGCGASSTKEKAAIEEEEEEEDEGLDVQDFSVPWTEEGYPAPCPPKRTKAEIYKPNKLKEVESNAVNTPDIFLDNYEGLIAHLTEPAADDLAKVRAIFVWLGYQNINTKKIGTVNNPDSPRAYLQQIQNRTGSYSSFFALLCRKAKVACVIIRGIGKSASYEVGDLELDNLNNNWNAVYVNGSWRFIHPLWAFLSLVGHRSGNWTLVETGGVQTQTKQEASEGELTFQLNDFWFLTDPDKMFVNCFPNDEEWQLLPSPRSLDSFKETPFVRKGFHELDLKIKTTKKCRLESTDGELEIILEVPKSRLGKLKLTYDLFFRESDSAENTVNNVQLDRFVFMNYRKNEVVFSIRFPTIGIYKISLFGHDVEEKQESMDWLVDFRMACGSAKGECQPLPDCPDIGWGPSVEAKQAGMEAITHHEGLIKLPKPQDLDIHFKLHRPTELKSEMLHNKIQKNELLQFVKTTVTENKASIRVGKLPEPGEYALKLHFRQAVSGQEFYNVVNYLITNPEVKEVPKAKVKAPRREAPIPDPVIVIQPKIKEPRKENGYLRNIRKALQEAIEGEDIEEIERTMAAFIKQQLEDNGDLTNAKERVEFLKLKKGLLEAIMRRHVDVLDVAIQNARNSKYLDKLNPRPLKDAENLRTHLSKMDKTKHHILKLNQRTISEIASYKHPPKLIKGVMTCTFLLLGEKQDQLKNWNYIQSLLRKTGQYSVKRRITVFDTVNLMEDTVHLARSHLTDIDLDQAKECSAGTGTFFKWSTGVMEASHFDKKTLPRDSPEPNYPKESEVATAQDEISPGTPDISQSGITESEDLTPSPARDIE